MGMHVYNMTIDAHCPSIIVVKLEGSRVARRVLVQMFTYLYRRISYDDKSRVSVSVALLITLHQPEKFLLIVRVFILLLISSFFV